MGTGEDLTSMEICEPPSKSSLQQLTIKTLNPS
jgi:hypothetical protein